MLDLAAAIDVVKKSGSWYSYGETRIGQGRENAKNFLKENPDIMEEITRTVREKYGFSPEGQKIDAQNVVALPPVEEGEDEFLLEDDAGSAQPLADAQESLWEEEDSKNFLMEQDGVLPEDSF